MWVQSVPVKQGPVVGTMYVCTWRNLQEYDEFVYMKSFGRQFSEDGRGQYYCNKSESQCFAPNPRVQFVAEEASVTDWRRG